MKKNKKSGFAKREEIRLEFGAIIIPIYRKRQGAVNNAELVEYLLEVRKAKCEFKEECIDVLVFKTYCVGFSCEKCPFNKPK